MTFIRVLLAAGCLVASYAPVSLAEPAGIVTKTSRHDVTTNRLEKILLGQGITVLARTDHASGAKKVKQDLPPTELLMFGNPKLGTP
jgi:uncharacterized protein (DUF302 family)